MKSHVLAMLLLVGCAHTGGVVIKPIPAPTADTVRKDLERAQQVLVAVESASSIVCSLAGAGTNVCLTLSHSMDVVSFALQHARDLFEQFEKGGLDIVVVEQAVQVVFDGLDQFGGAVQVAKGLMTNGTDHPVAMPYCTRCCGVVVDPSATKARAAPNPYCKPSPAAKAP